METKLKLRGMLLASLTSSLWAISGISGEILFKQFNFFNLVILMALRSVL